MKGIQSIKKMKNKKIFNNLFDSICFGLIFIFYVIFYLFVIQFGVINHSEGTNPTATLIICSSLFVPGMLTIAIFIVLYCYEYWTLTDEFILHKKLFRNKTVILLKEITKVEKKTIPALKLGVYKTEAYIIYSNEKKIAVFLNKKNDYFELEQILNELIT